MEELLSKDNLIFLLRFLHFFFGVIWLGLLYYFNFVQGPFMAETELNIKNILIQKMLPRALWWFRYAALGTFLTGITLLSLYSHLYGTEFLISKFGGFLLIGAVIGILMFLNVWLLIWPKQKIVIASAENMISGGPGLPEAPMAAALALRVSRHNVLFSLPMLFFMAAGRHLNISYTDNNKMMILWALVVLIFGGLQYNAIKGKLGPLTTVRGVIMSGFALTMGLLAITVLLK